MAKNSVTRNQRNEQRVKYERLREAGRWQPGNFTGDPTARRGYKPAAGMDKVGVKQMPAPTGESVVGNRLNKVASALKQVGPAFRAVTPKQQVVSNVMRERVTPVPAAKTAAAPKAKETAYQRQQRMAQQKMGVAGPRGGVSKTSSGGMRSTGGGSRSGGGAVGSTSGTRGYSSGGNAGRGDVGAGRRGGGR